MKFDKARLAESLSSLQEEIVSTASNLREKGPRHFMRPLAFLAIVVYGCYALALGSAQSKLKKIEKKLATARATAQYADTYREQMDALRIHYYRLPSLSHRDRWLFETYIETLKAENIVSDLKPPSEEEISGLIYQRIEMTSKLKFAQIVAMLARLEAIRPVIRVTRLSFAKDLADLGMNGVACTLETAIPKKRYGAGG